MGAALALALASLALGAGELQLDTGLHLEARGRDVSQRVAADKATVEALAIPTVSATWFVPELRLVAAYSPRLRAPDLTRHSELTVLHAAELQLATRPDRAWRLTGSARGERGTTDLLTEGHLVGSELQTITTTSRLGYQAVRAQADVTGRLDPRTTLTLGGGAFIDGGEGARAEATLPLERGVRALAGLEFRATRLDLLGLRAAALGTRLDRGPTSGLVTLDASWRRRFTRAVDGWLGAGAGAGYEDPRAGIAKRRLMPTAELGASHTPPAPEKSSEDQGAPTRETPSPRIASQAALKLSPIIDRATGQVDPQLEASLRALWPVTPRWSLGANAVAAVVWQTAGDARRGRLDAAATWAARDWVRLGAGVYGSVQRATTPALPSFDEVGVYVSLDLAAPSLRP